MWDSLDSKPGFELVQTIQLPQVFIKNILHSTEKPLKISEKEQIKHCHNSGHIKLT